MHRLQGHWFVPALGLMLSATAAAPAIAHPHVWVTVKSKLTFTPDGKHVLYAASLNGWVNICIADSNGGNMNQLSHVKSSDVSPKVNPKTGREVLFISGRSGVGQIEHHPQTRERREGQSARAH